MVGKIKGTGSYRPVQVWDNDKLSHMMDTSDEWIRGRTGIGQRHIASGGETVAYMAARAAEGGAQDGKLSQMQECDRKRLTFSWCLPCHLKESCRVLHAKCRN